MNRFNRFSAVALPVLALAAPSSFAQTTDQRIAILEADVSSLKSDVKRILARLDASIPPDDPFAGSASMKSDEPIASKIWQCGPTGCQLVPASSSSMSSPPPVNCSAPSQRGFLSRIRAAIGRGRGVCGN